MFLSLKKDTTGTKRGLKGAWSAWVMNCEKQPESPESGRKRHAEVIVKREASMSPILALVATCGAVLSRVRRLFVLDGGKVRRGLPNIVLSFLVRISVTLVVAVVALETPGANVIEEKKMVSESKRGHLRKVLDIERTKVWTRIISAFHDMLRAPGQTEWSPARLQGVLGNAFSFEMKKGGGDVWQEGNLDWWLVFETRPEAELGCRIQRFQARQGDTDPDESRKIKADAWDAVRASIDRGIPAAAWAPMYPKEDSARDWGLLVGYDEADESYIVRRRGGEFGVRYDEIGDVGPPEDFCVFVYDGSEQVRRAEHPRQGAKERGRVCERDSIRYRQSPNQSGRSGPRRLRTLAGRHRFGSESRSRSAASEEPRNR